jgi:hypothetical protein
LAIWKSQCLMNMPNCKRERDMGNYLAAQEWARSGWKKRKHEVRTSNAIGIIVSAVRPFLEKGPTATGELDGTPS